MRVTHYYSYYDYILGLPETPVIEQCVIKNWDLLVCEVQLLTYNDTIFKLNYKIMSRNQ